MREIGGNSKEISGFQTGNFVFDNNIDLSRNHVGNLFVRMGMWWIRLGGRPIFKIDDHHHEIGEMSKIP